MLAKIEVWAAQPPGCERRIGDSPFRRVEEMAKWAIDAGGSAFEAPYALFGHSLGACVAYEVARRLARALCSPLHLFVSGQSAPHRPDSDDRPPMHRLSDEALIDRLREIGGTPPSILNDEQMMELLLPTVRADAEAAETYDVEPPRSLDLDCPMTILTGTDDDFVPRDQAAAWAELTTGQAEVTEVRGSHFFIDDSPQTVTEVVAAALSSAREERSR